MWSVSVFQDKAFENQKLYQPHNNPAAELSSSLSHYQQHSLERAYKGVDFFWALTPSQNDYILFKFPQPVHVSGYVNKHMVSCHHNESEALLVNWCFTVCVQQFDSTFANKETRTTKTQNQENRYSNFVSYNHF